MKDDELESERLPEKKDIFAFFASREPLSEDDSMPEVERPPAEPATCFDDWLN